MKGIATVCLFAVITVAAPSQTTHFVGAGGLAQIRDALAVANPGDIILVQPGTYAHFEANVGVTIRALQPRSVFVEYQLAFMPLPHCTSVACANGLATVLEPPAGQTLHVVGLDFVGNSVSFQGGLLSAFHHVKVRTGRVTLDDCQLTAQRVDALQVDSATLHLQQCTIAAAGPLTPGGAGMAAVNSTVTSIGCQFLGADGTFVGPPMPGVRLQGSRLHASRIVATGGSGIFTSLGSGTGLQVIGNSSVWLSDSTLQGGLNACAVSGLGAGVRLDRCVLTDNAPGCAAATPAGFLLGSERPAPVVMGSTFTLNFRTESNGFVLVFAGAELGTIDYAPILEQPSWLADPGSFVAALVIADAAGSATASWPIPVGPFADAKLWFQGISGFALPMQVSPVAGGVVR